MLGTHRSCDIDSAPTLLLTHPRQLCQVDSLEAWDYKEMLLSLVKEWSQLSISGRKTQKNQVFLPSLSLAGFKPGHLGYETVPLSTRSFRHL